MAEHNILGKTGEEAAVRYLLSKNYLIRHRNWHSGKRDLDIITEKAGELVIVEVKTRTDDLFGNPEEAVDEKKIRHIIESTDAYIQMYEIDKPVRFDVISVTGEKPPFRIEHIPEAFYPPLW